MSSDLIDAMCNGDEVCFFKGVDGYLIQNPYDGTHLFNYQMSLVLRDVEDGVLSQSELECAFSVYLDGLGYSESEVDSLFQNLFFYCELVLEGRRPKFINESKILTSKVIAYVVNIEDKSMLSSWESIFNRKGFFDVFNWAGT